MTVRLNFVEQECGYDFGRGPRPNLEHARQRPEEQRPLHRHHLERRQKDLVQVLGLQHPGLCC